MYDCLLDKNVFLKVKKRITTNWKVLEKKGMNWDGSGSTQDYDLIRIIESHTFSVK